MIYFDLFRFYGQRRMSISDWARKVAAAVLVAPGERAPIDAVLVDYIDEFEQLARTTRLKIPAFARALTAAGLTMASGAPYDSATLRTQINRARAKRSVRDPDGRSDPPLKQTLDTRKSNEEAGLWPPRRDREHLTQAVTRPSKAFSALEKLERSMPKKARRLDDNEGG